MLNTLTFIIKGGGEMASGIAWRLYRSGFHKIIMLETAEPMAIRRKVCFSEAVYDMNQTVDGVTAELAADQQDAAAIMARGSIVVMIDPKWRQIGRIKPDIVIDAILAKKIWVQPYRKRLWSSAQAPDLQPAKMFTLLLKPTAARTWAV